MSRICYRVCVCACRRKLSTARVKLYAQAMFHELGLNTRQAQALAEWFNGESQQAAAAQAQAQEARWPP